MLKRDQERINGSFFPEDHVHLDSKYPGTCKVCTKPIEVDDAIVWNKEVGAAHEGCVDCDCEDTGGGY